MCYSKYLGSVLLDAEKSVRVLGQSCRLFHCTKYFEQALDGVAVRHARIDRRQSRMVNNTRCSAVPFVVCTLYRMALSAYIGDALQLTNVCFQVAVGECERCREGRAQKSSAPDQVGMTIAVYNTE